MSPDPKSAPYISEYMTAMDRTAELGLQTPPRVLVSNNCVDPDRTLTALLDYRHTPGELVGQTVAINLALMPILLKTTGVPFQFTIGWIEREGRAHFEHNQILITRFLAHKEDAWRSEGLPFHIWLTSPALEILDVTFAMNLGWAQTRQECARLVIYQTLSDAVKEPIYHPTLLGSAFFERINLVVGGSTRGEEVDR
jgi:hypothetical protein